MAKFVKAKLKNREKQGLKKHTLFRRAAILKLRDVRTNSD